MEAVVDKISSHQKEDELRSGGTVDLEDDLAGKDRYIASIEGLIRNNIQQYKIDMADEVINAGRFDQRTTHEERRLTLETLLHDEERYQETVHDVPSLQEVNRMIARSEEEVELFDQMDEELDWTEEMTRYDRVPKWLRASSREVNATIASLSKKPLKKTLLASNIGVESSEIVSDLSPTKTERKRSRPKGSLNDEKISIYRELDDENGEFSEASSEERNVYSLHEEEGEIGEFEDEECSGAVDPPPSNKDQSEENGPVCDGGYEYPRASEGTRNNRISDEVNSSGSSSESRRLAQMVSPSISPQKFGSLSALDARPGSLSKRLPDELEEGEIAVSGDSQMDLQQSGSWIHDRDDGEDEQVLQPKIKRKRSIRIRPRHTVERLEEKSSNEKPSLQHEDSSQLAVQVDHKYEVQLRTDPVLQTFREPVAVRHDPTDSVLKSRRNLPSRKIANSPKLHVLPKPSRLNCMSAPAEDAAEHTRESWVGKSVNTSGPAFFGTKMSDIMQRKCKNVISKLQRRIDKDGHQIVPLLTSLWKRSENSSYMSGMAENNVLDLRKIDQRVDRSEYTGVMEFVADMQSMLKSAAQYFGFSYEVRSEARKVQDLFFDIMKIAFPDTDLHEARNAVSFSGPGATSALSPRQAAIGQSKRHKLINEVEPDLIPSPKLLSCVPISAEEDMRTRGHMPQKESRLASGSGREKGQVDEAPLLTHPGELVICKKKRKDRDKSAVKPRTGPMSTPSIGRNVRSPDLGPVPGPGPGPGPVSVQKDVKMNQQVTHQHGWAHQSSQQGNGGGGTVGWANPVKRMRTDNGKRRPSHL
ncbi:hypothetical protein HHK36_001171 [Tetracentron sinense]|uniref:Bromo domain-containing protein n=1 Tax=Tetracentron sinense TaxID=13715 RepID=A0A834ZT97_TETSI|nr:hypothetical protein HHK36_001171 [Tetracentron sinense]